MLFKVPFSTLIFRSLLLGLLATHFACEEPVDLDLMAVEPELVVTSAFFPDETVKVRLSSTFPTIGERVLTEITDATVSILDGNEVVETLRYVAGTDGGPGSYRGNSFIPRVNRLYTLYATRDGYLPFEAVSSIPSPVAISDLRINNLRESAAGSLRVLDFDLLVNYDDPEDANFYDLRVSQIVQPFYLAPNGDTIKQDIQNKVLGDRGDTADRNTGPGEISVLVRDKPNPQGIRLNVQTRHDPRHEILLDLRAELRTVSPSYFDYQILRQREGQTLPLGVGDPRVSSFSTDDRPGVGVFAGYNRVVWTLSLPR